VIRANINHLIGQRKIQKDPGTGITDMQDDLVHATGCGSTIATQKAPKGGAPSPVHSR